MQTNILHAESKHNDGHTIKIKYNEQKWTNA